MLSKAKSPEIVASCQLPFNILSIDPEPYRKNGSDRCTSCRRRILTMMTRMRRRRRKTRRIANHLDRDE
jgi:PP-loop superfamily ATP-utilizing enzyme